MITLVIQSGKHKGQQLKLPNRPVVVGRDETCEIRLAAPAVSRRHCTVQVLDNRVFVRDLGSSLGTFIDEEAIVDEAELCPGSVLRVGPMTFELLDGGSLEDNEIADWLTNVPPSDEDTAIIHGGDTSRVRPVPKTAPPPPPVEYPEFDSVAEEAQYIIRRFQELRENPESESDESE